MTSRHGRNLGYICKTWQAAGKQQMPVTTMQLHEHGRRITSTKVTAMVYSGGSTIDSSGGRMQGQAHCGVSHVVASATGLVTLYAQVREPCPGQTPIMRTAAGHQPRVEASAADEVDSAAGDSLAVVVASPQRGASALTWVSTLPQPPHQTLQ